MITKSKLDLYVSRAHDLIKYPLDQRDQDSGQVVLELCGALHEAMKHLGEVVYPGRTESLGGATIAAQHLLRVFEERR